MQVLTIAMTLILNIRKISYTITVVQDKNKHVQNFWEMNINSGEYMRKMVSVS
jgi:hypothetical protein